MNDWLTPDWPAPPNVRALVTTRHGGVSVGPWASMNLALHVGDDADAVATNRALLRGCLPAEPCWLEQVHGVVVADADRHHAQPPRADAVVSREAGRVCAVLTADCLPVLLCADNGERVAAVHAGWRGMAAGVLETAVAAMGRPGGELLAWLGPAIGPAAFEVGPEVRTAFVSHDAGAEDAFAAGGGDRWFADLYALARLRLRAVGVTRVYGGGWCTVGDATRFYSYRRDGITGRMASLVWRTS